MPAAAMKTSTPRSSAAAIQAESSPGVRWAESTRTSQGTPNASSCSTQWRIVSQSDLEPITTPTSGCAISTSVRSGRCSLEPASG